jgi:hypothetical protein
VSSATGDPPSEDAEVAFVVHVKDAISTALAGHDGLEYRSPPLAQEEALALVRVLVGDDPATAGTHSWRCPVAGGQRTVTLRPAPGIDPAAIQRELAAEQTIEHKPAGPSRLGCEFEENG